MANIAALGTFFPRRLSEYVPAMQYVGDVNIGGDMRISFGAPALAVTTSIITAQDMTAGGTLQAASLNSATADAPWGRNITYAASTTATNLVTVDGWDYLGQAMTEQVTLTSGTPVVGKKAFKYIRQVTFVAVAANLIMGFGAAVGLPYKAIKVWTEEADGVPAAAGTLTAAILTDPQTISTGDPRGTYASTTAFNGVKVITATFAFANDVNAANNGGFHGIAHFSS